MKTIIKAAFVSLIIIQSIMAYSEPNPPKIKEENITYQIDGTTYKAYIAFDENLKGARPTVLVVHEWWGLNDYSKMRARMLAELGYLAMAVDLFGNGALGTTPEEAQKLTGPFYKDPSLGKMRLDAAINKIKENPNCDKSKIAAIGYCFGGSVVLNSAKLGANINGVVSFHGGLKGVDPKKGDLKAKILVCHGGADKFVPEQDVETFKHQLDSVGATYTFKVYPNATHTFTNPEATKIGKQFNMPIEYNEAADKASWEDMKVFLKGTFSSK